MAPSISLADSAPTEICAASDALNTIRVLQTRVERLEEGLGKLLLEKEGWEQNAQKERNNCCVTFSDPSGDLERSVVMRGHNCCVSFRGRSESRAGHDERRKQKGLIVCLLIIAAMVVGIVAVSSGCRGKGCEVEMENS